MIISEGIFRGLPQRHARALLVDIPWHHESWSAAGQTRTSPSHHYETMTLQQACALPVRDLCARDAWVFFWTTGPHLEQAFEVGRAWGMTYSGFGLNWLKQTRLGRWHIGTGKTTRANMEPCLLFRFGKPRVMAHDVQELMITVIRRHSQKPYETHKRIERFAAGPYLELFARVKRPGWRCWGFEAPDLPGSIKPLQDDLRAFMEAHGPRAQGNVTRR